MGRLLQFQVATLRSAAAEQCPQRHRSIYIYIAPSTSIWNHLDLYSHQTIYIYIAASHALYMYIAANHLHLYRSITDSALHVHLSTRSTGAYSPPAARPLLKLRLLSASRSLVDDQLDRSLVDDQLDRFDPLPKFVRRTDAFRTGHRAFVPA